MPQTVLAYEPDNIVAVRRLCISAFGQLFFVKPFASVILPELLYTRRRRRRRRRTVVATASLKFLPVLVTWSWPPRPKQRRQRPSAPLTQMAAIEPQETAKSAVDTRKCKGEWENM